MSQPDSGASAAPSPAARRIALAVSIAIGVAIAAVGWWKALGVPASRTGARVVTWYGPDGQPVELTDGCDSIDLDVRNLVDGEGMWTSCRGPGFESGAFAFIEPARGEGHIRWLFPDAGEHDQTHALYPDAERGLGVVFGHAAGVAGPDGWLVEPARLPGEHLVGGAWTPNGLELVVITLNDQYEQVGGPVVVTVGASLVSRAPFPTLEAQCGDLQWCRRTEVAQYRGGRWHFLIEAMPEGTGRLSWWWVTEAGERVPTGWDPQPGFPRSQIDLVTLGFVTHSHLFEWRLAADGSLESPVPPPRPGWTARADWDDFRIAGSAIVPDRVWQLPDTSTVVRSVAGRWLSTNHISADDAILMGELDDTETVSAKQVAHEPDYECYLTRTTLIPRAAGGFWLASNDGCYLAVDDELARADPLSLSEHLSRRGSRGHDWNETKHLYRLWFVLGGLPLLIVIFVWIGWLIRRHAPREARRAAMEKAALGAGATYVVFAGYYLSKLLPLLT